MESTPTVCIQEAHATNWDGARATIAAGPLLWILQRGSSASKPKCDYAHLYLQTYDKGTTTTHGTPGHRAQTAFPLLLEGFRSTAKISPPSAGGTQEEDIYASPHMAGFKRMNKMLCLRIGKLRSSEVNRWPRYWNLRRIPADLI